MALTPTAPVNPAQRIDQVWSDGQLVEELVWTHPIDGTGIRRRDGQPDEPVAGLPIPTPDPRAELRAAIAAAESPAELQSLMLQLIDLGV